MQTMHGGREELVPKYQISPVTHPVSARAPCVHYDSADTRYSWHSAMWGPRCPQACPLDLLAYGFTALYCGTGHQRPCSEQLWHAENGAGAGPPVYGEHVTVVTVVSVVTGDHPGQGKKRKFVWVRAQGAGGVKLCPIFISRISHFLISFHNNTIIKISSGAIPGYFGISSLILSTRPTWG